MVRYKTGFVAGKFDLIHPGYIKLFKFAKKYCDFLIVAIKYIDKVISYNLEKDLIKILNKLPISVRFLDEEYKQKKITGNDLNIPIKWVPRKHSYSTTELIKKIKLL